MQDILKKYLSDAKLRRNAYRRMVAMLIVLSMMVSFSVTWSLRIDGQAAANEPTCGVEEHKHTLSCYARKLVCTQEGAVHTHTEECYVEEKILSCGLEDHVHSKEDGCYEEQTALACTTPEHTHAEACYNEAGDLICQSEEHIHSEACYAASDVLVCDKAGHEHTADCYDADGQLVCQYAQPHAHTDNCYATQKVLACEQTEEPHVHTDACYADELTCTKPEHTHTVTCYADPTADVETAEDWEKTLPEKDKLTGSWGEDVISVAKSQLGYRESARNYELDEDGVTINGYTRYGQWYGIPYGQWCAMFASFCLNYAGVPEEAIPREAGVVAWRTKLESMNLYTSFIKDETASKSKTETAKPSAYLPKAGDLVFFDLNRDDDSHDPSHVGIVSEYDETYHVLYVYEGNSNNQVQLMAYLMPGFTQPDAEEQEKLPEEERFQMPEVCMQAEEDTIVGCASIEQAKKVYDEKVARGELPGKVIADDDASLIGNEAATVQAWMDDSQSKKVYLRVMIDGQWENLDVLTSQYDAAKGRAYVTRQQVEERLREYGFDGTLRAGEFGHAHVSDPYYSILYAADQTKCLSFVNDKAVVWDYDPSQAKSIFRFEYCGKDGIYQLQNMGLSGENNGTIYQKSLNIAGGSAQLEAAKTGQLQYYPAPLDDLASQWRMEKTANGNYIFHSVFNDHYVVAAAKGEAANASTELVNGNKIHLKDTDYGELERWQLVPVFMMYNDAGVEGDKIYLGRAEQDDYICYYIPGAANGAINGQLGTTIDRQYSFCSVTVDLDNQANAFQERIVRYDSTLTVRVPAGKHWVATNSNGQVRNLEVVNEGDTDVLTLRNIRYPIQIMAEAQELMNATRVNHKVTFKTIVDGEWMELGSLPYYYAPSDATGGRAFITSGMAAEFFGQFGFKENVDPAGTIGVSFDDLYRFYFVKDGTKTNYCMDVNNAAFESGTHIHLWENNGGDAQQFRIIDAYGGDAVSGSKYIVPNNHTDLHVNASGGIGNDKQIWIHSATGGASCWNIEYGENSAISFISAADPTYCIDVNNGNLANGERIHTWDKGSTNRWWYPAKEYNIWNTCDTSVPAENRRLSDNSYKILLQQGSYGDYAVFYIPSAKGQTWEKKRGYEVLNEVEGQNRGFYSVTVRDPSNVLYTVPELDELTRYVPWNGSAEITLKMPGEEIKNSYHWVAIGETRDAAGTRHIAMVPGTRNDAAGTTTFNLTNVTGKWRIMLVYNQPQYTVGYKAKMRLLQKNTSGNNNLAVYNTSGKNLPQNWNGEAKDKLIYLGLDGNGRVVYKEPTVPIYAERGFLFEEAPGLYFVDILSNYDGYDLESVDIYLDGMQIYSGTVQGVSFTNDINDERLKDPGNHCFLITDLTYIDLIYKPAEDSSKIDTTFFDYNLQTWDGYTRQDGLNRGINWEGGNWDWAGKQGTTYPKFLFGNANSGVGDVWYGVNRDGTGTMNCDGNDAEKPNYSFASAGNLGVGKIGADGQMTYSYVTNFRGCYFGIVNPTGLASDGTPNFTIAHPTHLFDTVDRPDKVTQENYNLVFARKGNSFTLQQVAGKGNDGYMKKHGLEGETADLTQLWHPSYGGTTHNHIFTNNFWPLDIPTNGGWDNFGGKTYEFSGAYGNPGTVNNVTSNGSYDLPTSDDGYKHNNLFGMTTTLDFHVDKDYVGPMEYVFYGDDDLWVYLVKKDASGNPDYAHAQLIIDIGGVHFSAGMYANLRDYIPAGTAGDYQLKIFYTERGFSGSTCYMSFNLPSVVTTRAKTTSVSLTKELRYGTEEDENRDYTFTFKAKTGETQLDYEVPYFKYTVDGALLTNGMIRIGSTFTLKAGQKIVINGLPQDGEYFAEFTETPVDGFDLEISGMDRITKLENGASFKINQNADENELTFTNVRKTTDVTVKKVVTGLNAADYNGQFFRIQAIFYKGSGAPAGERWYAWLPGTYDYEVHDAAGNPVTGVRLYNKDGSVVADSSKIKAGDCFDLKPNWTLTIKNLPVTAYVGFYEQDYSDRFTTTWAVSGTHDPTNLNHTDNGGATLSNDKNGCYFALNPTASENLATCTNEVKLTDATVKKVVTGLNAGASGDQPFRIQAILYKGEGVSGSEKWYAWLPGSFDYEVRDAAGNPVTGVQLYNKDGSAVADSSKIKRGDCFDLKPNWTLTIKNLPVTAYVGFYEKDYSDRFTTSWAVSGTHDPTNLNHTDNGGTTLSNDKNGCYFALNPTAAENLATCTNEVKLTDVSLNKTVNATNKDQYANEEFAFQVKLFKGLKPYATSAANADWGILTGEFEYEVTNQNGAKVAGFTLYSPKKEGDKWVVGEAKASSAKIVDGDCFYLKDGWTLTIKGLPINAVVGFYEKPYANMESEWSPGAGDHLIKNPNDKSNISGSERYIGDGCTMSLNATASENNVICYNGPLLTDVSMTKEVVPAGDSTKFTFLFECGTYLGGGGWKPVGLTFDYEITGGSQTRSGTIKREQQIELAGGETITVKNVPVGYKAEFWEKSADGYVTEPGTALTGNSENQNSVGPFQVGFWPDGGEWYKLGVYASTDKTKNHMVFRNTKMVKVEVEKVVEGENADRVPNDQLFYFQIWHVRKVHENAYDQHRAYVTEGATFTIQKPDGTTSIGTVGSNNVFTLHKGEVAQFDVPAESAENYIFVKEIFPEHDHGIFYITAMRGDGARPSFSGHATDQHIIKDCQENCYSYDSDKFPIDGTKAVYHTTVVNGMAARELPETGGEGVFGVMATGIVLMLLPLGVFVLQARRKRKGQA